MPNAASDACAHSAARCTPPRSFLPRCWRWLNAAYHRVVPVGPHITAFRVLRRPRGRPRLRSRVSLSVCLSVSLSALVFSFLVWFTRAVHAHGPAAGRMRSEALGPWVCMRCRVTRCRIGALGPYRIGHSGFTLCKSNMRLSRYVHHLSPRPDTRAGCARLRLTALHTLTLSG